LKIKSQTAIIATVTIVLAGVIITSALGLWQTTSTKVPQRYKQQEYSNLYDPADIRGSYTFLEISNLFDIPTEDLTAAFLIEERAAATFKCKDVELMFAEAPEEIGTKSVRMFVAFFKGLPYETIEETYLTEAAAQILKEKSDITADQLAYLENHTISL
jgi:hypothetical protein